MSAGTEVVWTAGAGCALDESAEYKFWIHAPGQPWVVARDYDPSPTYSWSTDELSDGAYDFQVWMRSAGSRSTYDSYAARSIRLQSQSACSGPSSLVPTAKSVAVGDAVVLNATTLGCSDAEYKFWMLQPGGGWAVVRDYASESTFTFESEGRAPGNYDFQVWARAAGTNSSYDSYAGARVDVSASIGASCTAAGPTSASPARAAHAGETVGLMSSAAECDTPEYEYWMLPPGGEWRILRGYDREPSYDWDTTRATAGTYYFQVWMRRAGSLQTYEAYTALTYLLKPPVQVCEAAELQFTSKGEPAAGVVRGSSLTVSGRALGCDEAEWKFWRQNTRGEWSLVRDWDSTPTLEWDTSSEVAGTYNWQIWVRGPESRTVYEAYTGAAVDVWPEGFGANGLVNDEQITVHSDDDVVRLRTRLNQAIWGDAGFPTENTLLVRSDVTSPLSSLTNLARVDELSISISARTTNSEDIEASALGYHFIPTSARGRAVLLLQGHECVLDDSQSLDDEGAGTWRTVNSLLTNGYSAVVLQMVGLTAQQCGCPSTWRNCQQPHDWLFQNVPSNPQTGGPMRFFIEPPVRVLNYLQTQAAKDAFPEYSDFSVVGFSGGGWATTVFAALDPRVALSIPVAGTLPLYLREAGEAGDLEQRDAPFYSIAGYPDLYVLGSYGDGRKQVQVLNRRDTCCFGEPQHPLRPGTSYDLEVRGYERRVRSALGSLGTGHFRVNIDEAASVHQISWSTVSDTLVAELNQSRRSVGAASKGHAFVRNMNGTLAQHSEAGWEDAGIPVIGVPAVLKRGPSEFDVFFRSPETNQLTHALGSGTTWTIETLPELARLNSDPVAASWADGDWDVVAVGNDYELYHWSFHGDGVSVQPVAKGLKVRGLPALLARAPGELDLFVRSATRSLMHLASDGEGAWLVDELAGRFLGVPSAVAEPVDGIGLYVADVDGGLIRGAPSGPGWGWTLLRAPVGDALSGSPSAAVKDDGTVQVHARTRGGALGTFSIANGWAYANQGGNIAGSPTAFPGGAYARSQRGELLRLEGQSWVKLGGNFD